MHGFRLVGERSLKLAGLAVLFADGTNGGDELIDGIGHLMAAHDRRRIVARLKAGRDAKAARHGDAARSQGGRLPHGYRRQPRTGLVEIEPEAAAEVRRIFGLVRQGMSIGQVAAIVSGESGRARRPTVVDPMVHARCTSLLDPGGSSTRACGTRRRPPSPLVVSG